jgi:rubrerythrin
MKPKDFFEVVTFAIAKEKMAVEFYSRCALRAKGQPVSIMLKGLIEEEEKHVAALQAFESGHAESLRNVFVQNLDIPEPASDGDFRPTMSIAELVLLAIQREEHSYHFYRSLVSGYSDPDFQRLFDYLANEELVHKQRLQNEYDDMVLKEN